MSTDKFDTRDWHLYVGMEFRRKPHAAYHKTCSMCMGGGKKTGRQLFGHYDEDDTCTECNGTGKVRTYHMTEKEPELPRGLIEAIRKTISEHVPPNYRTDSSEYYRV